MAIPNEEGKMPKKIVVKKGKPTKKPVPALEIHVHDPSLAERFAVWFEKVMR